MNDVVPDMSSPQTAKDAARPKKEWKTIDSVAAIVVTVIIVALGWTIYSKLSLKHEVNEAKVVTSKVIAALATQDTEAIRKLGDKSFQDKNSADSLNKNLTATAEDGSPVTFSELYGETDPTIHRQRVANNAAGQNVNIIYKYDSLKIPFYVSIDVNKAPRETQWKLQSLSASPNEASLLR